MGDDDFKMPDYWPEWLKRFVAMSESYFMVTTMIVMAAVPVVLFFALIWAVWNVVDKFLSR